MKKRPRKIAQNIQNIEPIDREHYLIMELKLSEEGDYIEMPVLLCNADFYVLGTLHEYRVVNHGASTKINALEMSPKHFVWQIYENKIYLGNFSNEYEITIFDIKGRKEKKITKEYELVQVPEIFKNNITAVYARQPELLEKIYFPKFMPAYQYFFVSDKENIYVMTYENDEKTGKYL